MAFTKATIIKKVEDELELSPAEARDNLETLIEIMKAALESGEDVMISGFGKFKVGEKASRKGRNPATGDSMTLDKRRVVTFKSSGKLKDELNKGRQND